MIKRLRNGSGSGVSDEEALTLAEAGMVDLLAALENVIDDEAALDRIYARAGQEKLSAPRAHDDADAAGAICDRIRMLEAVIAAAIKPRATTSLLSIEHMTIARRFLFELRSGLQAR
jgi:hypothetical protein